MIEKKRLWWAGGLVVACAALTLLLSPMGVAEEHEKPMMEGKANHFKCYPILDWTVWDPRKVELKDQFGESVARVLEPATLCNPVDKNGEGIPHPSSHLVCYRIQDEPQGNTPRIKEVAVRNQFGETRLWVGNSDMICLPSDKRYKPS